MFRHDLPMSFQAIGHSWNPLHEEVSDSGTIQVCNINFEAQIKILAALYSQCFRIPCSHSDDSATAWYSWVLLQLPFQMPCFQLGLTRRILPLIQSTLSTRDSSKIIISAGFGNTGGTKYLPSTFKNFMTLTNNGLRSMLTPLNRISFTSMLIYNESSRRRHRCDNDYTLRLTDILKYSLWCICNVFNDCSFLPAYLRRRKNYH